MHLSMIVPRSIAAAPDWDVFAKPSCARWPALGGPVRQAEGRRLRAGTTRACSVSEPARPPLRAGAPGVSEFADTLWPDARRGEKDRLLTHFLDTADAGPHKADQRNPPPEPVAVGSSLE